MLLCSSTFSQEENTGSSKIWFDIFENNSLARRGQSAIDAAKAHLQVIGCARDASSSITEIQSIYHEQCRQRELGIAAARKALRLAAMKEGKKLVTC